MGLKAWLHLILVLISSVLRNAEAMQPVLIIHGGAGTINQERAEQKKVGMKESIRSGFQALLNSDDPIEAVVAAVKVMENSPAFNAGYGSVQTNNGEVEMDAIIINGTNLASGAVGAMKHVRNPIEVAKFVMNSTSHVLLVGEFAEKFAASKGIELVPTSDLIPNDTATNTTMSRVELKILSKKNKGGAGDFDVGTVGAVAINSRGQIAAATSTGGLQGKMEGRVGDTPIIGGGTLADDEVAGISATGVGEAIMRYTVASKVAQLISQGRNATEAILTVLNGMTAKIPGGDGGCIAITKSGEVAFNWNSEQMAWAYVKMNEMTIHYGVNRGEDFSEPFGPHQVNLESERYRYDIVD